MCADLDFGATDRYSDGCAAYARKPYTCGTFDVPGFSSIEMCCACGGGDTISPPASPPQVTPLAPPARPPARPPLLPGHIFLAGGEDLNEALASDLSVEVIELEPEQLYNVTAPILVGAGNVTIKLSSFASDGSKPAVIEVDPTLH